MKQQQQQWNWELAAEAKIKKKVIFILKATATTTLASSPFSNFNRISVLLKAKQPRFSILFNLNSTTLRSKQTLKSKFLNFLHKITPSRRRIATNPSPNATRFKLFHNKGSVRLGSVIDGFVNFLRWKNPKRSLICYSSSCLLLVLFFGVFFNVFAGTVQFREFLSARLSDLFGFHFY